MKVTDEQALVDQNDAQVHTAHVSDRGVLAGIDRIVEAVALVMFVAMMGSVLLQVFARFAHVAILWTEELARVLLVASSVLAIAVGVRRREHIIVDYFVDRMRPAAHRRLSVVLDLLLLGFLMIWLRGAVNLAILNAGTHYVTVPWLAVSHLYIVEAIAIVLMLLFVVGDLVGRTKRESKP
jgi:TRAP-type C4-dicarboxylate transport system permease small subunit